MVRNWRRNGALPNCRTTTPPPFTMKSNHPDARDKVNPSWDTAELTLTPMRGAPFSVTIRPLTTAARLSGDINNMKGTSSYEAKNKPYFQHIKEPLNYNPSISNKAIQIYILFLSNVDIDRRSIIHVFEALYCNLCDLLLPVCCKVASQSQPQRHFVAYDVETKIKHTTLVN